MAEDDIYGNRKNYERFVADFRNIIEGAGRDRRSKYGCRYKPNLEYFVKLFAHFGARDLSFIRRLRIIQCMKFICSFFDKDLTECNRDDMDGLMSAMHQAYNTPKSKETFIRELKLIWKILFPEKDDKGRPDETIMPYAVRHLSPKIDKSRQKMRKDKLSLEEFESVVGYFARDPRIQAFLTLSLESLARPQELLYVKVGDVELFDNYAKIYISEHGKEGTGLIQCIDSYPYLSKWLSMHPNKGDKQSFLFVNIGKTNTLKQLRPMSVNKFIRVACKNLGINKPVTCYSLKRNGVTIRRLRGESDMEIQHAARWTSTNQLKTYDLSSQDEAFKKELQRRGLLAQDSGDTEALGTKKCIFCNTQAGFSETFCPNCKRPLDRQLIVEESKQKDQEIEQLRQQILSFNQQFAEMRQQMMQDMMTLALQIKSGQAP